MYEMDADIMEAQVAQSQDKTEVSLSFCWNCIECHIDPNAFCANNC